MLVTRRSLFTGVVRTINLDVTQEQMDSFEKGDKLIQEVFPNLSSADREFILTGATQEEWDTLREDEDEEE